MSRLHTQLERLFQTLLPIVILTIGIGGLAIVYRYCRPTPPMQEAELPMAPLVETVAVEPQENLLDIDVDGIVVPSRVITVPTEVAGKLIEKSPLCEAGCYVKKGTLLARIDPIDYELEVRRLDKELQQSKQNINELDVQIKNIDALIRIARATLEIQDRELERITKLAKKHYLTESTLDTERRSRLSAENILVTQENQLRLFRAERNRLESARDLVGLGLEKAKLDLKRTAILAPIDGIVIRDFAETDNYLARGTAVAELEDISRVEVDTNLRMDELFWILSQKKENALADSDSTKTPTENRPQHVRNYQIPPTPTTVIYRLNGKEYLWDGVLTRYKGIGLDEKTRTVPCTVVVINPDQPKTRAISDDKIEAAKELDIEGPSALVRGMFVDLIIHTRPSAALLKIPKEAIRPGNRVWAVRDGRLRIVPVQVISMMNSMSIVRPNQSGALTTTDRVIIVPIASAQDGMKVREKRAPVNNDDEASKLKRGQL
jgi:multidrug efflux pump subunit AcrA (membrane-fusion protein)